MWPGFDGRGYSREQWVAHVAQSALMPGAAGVTIHSTGIPTLKQAIAMNPANYIRNTQAYYENQLGWAHGPHAFADIGDGKSRPAIWGFSALDTRGTHCSCDNGRGFYGIECMGNRNTEDYASGPGALALENQHFAVAVLFVKMRKRPDASNFLPHSHCRTDGHFQCPVEDWEASWREKETAAVVAFMNTLGDRLPIDPDTAGAAVALYPPKTPPVFASPAWVQTALNTWIATAKPGHVPLVVDGDIGPSTRFVLRAYQAAHHLDVDGVAGPQTCAALKLEAA